MSNNPRNNKIVFNLGGVHVYDIYCINVDKRKDRRLRMQRQAKRRKFAVKFWKVKLNKDPIKGCLQSHLQIIQNAKRRKLPSILILEDDAKLTTKRLYIPTVPKNWDMLYLGGNVQKIIDDDEFNDEKYWKRATILTTHAYIIRDSIYDEVIKGLQNYSGPIDVFYAEEIHPRKKCCIVIPSIFTQFSGYSDVEGKLVNYDGILDKDVLSMEAEQKIVDKPPEQLDETELTWSKDQEGFAKCILKLPMYDDIDLPKVSIITPTYNRVDLFPIAVRNFYKFVYPWNKLEWVIIDDGHKDQLVNQFLPEDTRIKYVHCEVKEGQRLSIGQKRNIGVQCATNEIIVHMDDDDYYFPHSVLARVKVLLKNQTETGKQCVFSTMVGAYDLITKGSAFSFDVDVNGNRTRPCEATMIYTRQFWAERKFNEHYRTAEGFHFIRGRYDKCITMPYSFIMIAFTHKTNLTRELRRVIPAKEKSGNEISFTDLFDSETKEFIHLIEKEYE